MANPNSFPYWRYQDIQIPDVALRTQFEANMKTGNFAEALRILRANKNQLQGKSFVAETINTIINSLILVESQYEDGSNAFLSDLANKFNEMITELRNRGEFDSNIKYVPYNFVTYNNEIYMCYDSPPVGTLPTNENYWLLLNLDGDYGAPGTDLTMKFNWDKDTSYVPNDLVVYDNIIYAALSQNINTVPPDNPNIWLLFLKVTKGSITVGMTPPDIYTNNTVWFQTKVDPLTVSPTTPIVGLFKRYNEPQQIWEEMYPLTNEVLVVDSDEFANPIEYETRTLETNKLATTGVRLIRNLTEDSLIDVTPAPDMTPQEKSVYDVLQIFISTSLGAITFKTPEDMSSVASSVEINIRIV